MKAFSLSRLTAALLVLTNSALAAEDITLGKVAVTANKIS